MICICLVCGIPGSGKSTLSKALSQTIEKSNEKYKLIHIEYDNILPPPHFVQSEPSNTVSSDNTYVPQSFDMIDQYNTKSNQRIGIDENLGLWKQERNQVLRLAELFIQHLNKVQEMQFPEGKRPQEVSESVWFKFGQLVPSFVKNNHTDLPNVILLIDDNLYLHSMRYEYYKLARKYYCGFCQLYLKCSTQCALERNKLRNDNSQVAEDVILRMAKKFEVPNTDRFHWEYHSLQVNAEKDIEMCVIIEFIEKAMKNPVQTILMTDAGETIKSRLACSSSTCHQVDLILRKCISSLMASGKHRSSSEQHALSKRASSVKESIIKGFRDDCHSAFLMNHQISIEDAAKDPKSHFYIFVSDLFLSEMN